MRFSVHPYRLPLTAPLTLAGVCHAAREGVLLRAEDATGRVGWGDAAPLPGFSTETRDEAAAALARLDGWRGRWDDAEAIAALDLPPSARFALETALLDLAAQAADRPMPHLLHPDPEVSLEVNALLAGDDPDALAREAAARAAEGYRTLKLKVGRRPVEADVALVRTVRDRVGPAVALRADANRAWTLEEASTFAQGVRGLGLAYVEEPLRDPAELPVLWFDTGLPIALDESLAGTDPDHLEGKGWAAAVVLKPTLLGGIARTLAFAHRARALGIVPVLSAAFESGVALRAAVALAAATGGAAAGLDPYRRLAADTLAPRLPLDRPMVDVPALFRTACTVTLAP